MSGTSVQALVGEARVYIDFDEGQGVFFGYITAHGHTWAFNDLRQAPLGPTGDDKEWYAKAISAAVSFGTYYTSSNRSGEVPSWAPPAETADALADATSEAYRVTGEYDVKFLNWKDVAGEDR